MADEEKNEKSFWDSAADTVSAVGGLAKGALAQTADTTLKDVPIVGPLLRISMNTPGYQAEQRAAEDAKISSDLLRAKAAEWNKNADVRESDRQVALQKNKEFLANAPTRKLQNDAEAARAQANLLAADTLTQKQLYGDAVSNLKQDLSRNGFLAGFTNDEVDGMFANLSPEMNMEINKLAVVPFIRSGDPTKLAFVERQLNRLGYQIQPREGKVPVITGTFKDANGKEITKAYEATPENLSAVLSSTAKKMLPELEARREIAGGGPLLGQVMPQSYSYYGKQLMPFAKSGVKVKEMLTPVYDNASDREREYHSVVQAYRDWKTQKPGWMQEMGSLQNLMPKMGYTVTGLNEFAASVKAGQPNPNLLQFAKQGELPISISDLAGRCAAQDTLGQRLDQIVGNEQSKYINQIKMLNAQQAQQIRQSLKADKAAGKKGTENNTTEENGDPLQMQMIDTGKNFAKQFGISANGILAGLTRDKKKSPLKSENDVYSALGVAKQSFDKKYLETRDIGQAREAANRVLKAAGIPDGAVPELFGDEELRQNIVNDTAALRELQKKDSEQRKSGKYKGEMPTIPMVGMPNAGDPLIAEYWRRKNNNELDNRIDRGKLAQRINENEEKLRNRKAERKKSSEQLQRNKAALVELWRNVR